MTKFWKQQAVTMRGGWILKPERLHQSWTKSCQATQKTITSLSAKPFPTPRCVVSLLVLSSATHVVERPQPVQEGDWLERLTNFPNPANGIHVVRTSEYNFQSRFLITPFQFAKDRSHFSVKSRKSQCSLFEAKAYLNQSWRWNPKSAHPDSMCLTTLLTGRSSL